MSYQKICQGEKTLSSLIHILNPRTSDFFLFQAVSCFFLVSVHNSKTIQNTGKNLSNKEQRNMVNKVNKPDV